MNISLSPPCLADIPEMVAGLSDARVADMLSSIPPDYCAADARAFIEGIATPDDLAVRLDGRLVGMVRAGPELGYWIAAPYWRRGIGRRAATLALRRSFAAGLAQVTASHYAFNKASGNLLKSLGFREVGPVTMPSRRLGPQPGRKLVLAAADFQP